MILKYSIVIAIAFPIVALIVLIIAVSGERDASMGGVVGFDFAYSMVATPLIIFAGSILQGIYNFSTAKSLFAKIKKFTIYQNNNGSFSVFFREKIKKQWIIHRLEITFLDATHCHLTHITINANQESNERCSKDMSIHEAAKYTYSIYGNLSALFAFLSRCLSLQLQNNKTTLLHLAEDSHQQTPPSAQDYYRETSQIPQAIKDLHARDNKTIAKRFFGLMAVIASPFIATWLYANSAFYPCGLYNAVADRDAQKVEKLLKAGLDPNVQCHHNFHILVTILETILNFPSSKMDTPLDRAVEENGKLNYETLRLYDTNEIIQLLIESGAKLKESHLKNIFKYGSTAVTDLFIDKMGLRTKVNEEQAKIIFTALKDRYIRNEQDYQKYEELLAWCLEFLPHNKQRQELLDNAFSTTGRVKKAKLFLKYGANINTLISNGETRLMLELRSTPLDDDFVIMLLEHGINVNIKNNHNNTALDIFNRQNQKGWYQEDKREIEALLKAKGAKSGAEL